MQGEPITQRLDDTPRSKSARHFVLRSVLPGQKAALKLVGERWRLGRGEKSELRLGEPGVSREHAEICRRGPSYTIRDAGSTNGTFVNGRRVEHASIGQGTIIRLGEWLGVVEEHAECERGPYHCRELLPGLWGGALLAKVLGSLLAVAKSSLPVVVIGETGTGKEHFARAVHDAGGSTGPFHAINCAALPPALAEAELFGYRKGAFTGAERGHDGHLRAAHGGTLFLDEVADLPLPLQAKLLRAIERGELAPLGDTGASRFSARVVAASQTPLADLVSAGRMREDFAARLNGMPITLPDIRRRRGDVPGLFDAFLRRHSGATAPAISCRLLEALCLSDWPGNVRQIELLARRLLALHGLEKVLHRQHLPDDSDGSPERSSTSKKPRPIEEEVRALAGALKDAGGNVKAAAESAGITRQRAYRLIGSQRLSNVVAASRGGLEKSDDQHEE